MPELFDVVDTNGNPTGKTVTRELAHSQGIWHRTAHVWLVRKNEEQLQILLQKRTQTKDSFPGCYDISSAGHIPAGTDFITSALRELEEELGIRANASELVYCGDRKIITDNIFHGAEFHDRQYSRVFLLWLDLDEKSFSIQPEEIDSIKWLAFDECLEGVKNNAFPHCIEVEELLMVKAKTTK